MRPLISFSYRISIDIQGVLMTSAVIGLEALNRELPNFQGLLNYSPGVVRMLILDPPEGAGPIRYPREQTILLLDVCM